MADTHPSRVDFDPIFRRQNPQWASSGFMTAFIALAVSAFVIALYLLMLLAVPFLAVVLLFFMSEY